MSEGDPGCSPHGSGLPAPAWCDTHCHLDAEEFAGTQQEILARSRAAGVTGWIVPAVAAHNFDGVRALAHRTAGMGYALGIHPLCVGAASAEHIDLLEACLAEQRNDPLLLAVGEIGLDRYPGHPDFEQQSWFFVQQLRLARRYDLPVIMHARRAADQVHAGLRRFRVSRGIVHAFNGSAAQAEALIRQGMLLGFGGALSFEGSRQIRRLAAALPLQSLVLETDAPDIRPQWFGAGSDKPNEPAELARIGALLARLRSIPEEDLRVALAGNLAQLFPAWTKNM